MVINKIRIFSIVKMVCALMLFALIAKTVKFDLIEKVDTDISIYEFSQEYQETSVKPGETVEYEVLAERTSFDCLDFFMEEEGRNFQVAFLDEEGQILFDQVISEEDVFYDNAVQKPAVRIKTGEVFPKGQYTVRIANLSRETLRIDALKEGNVLDVRVVKYSRVGVIMALLVGLILIGYAAALWYLLRKKSFSMPQFFLVSVIPLSLVYLLMLAPWSAPDSNSHFTAAYRFSNRILGCPRDEEWLGRADDAEFYRLLWRNGNPKLRDYVGLTSDIKILADDKSLVEMPFDIEKGEAMKYYSILNYWPQIFGLTVGRLLGLSSFLCIYLARVCILLFYIAACYHAIKLVPIGKSIFTLIPLLPISLVMSSAISYDSMVLPVSLNLVANILALYKTPEDKRRMFETMIWAFMAGAVKGGGYLILLPAAFILYDGEEKRKSTGLILKIVLSGLISVILFDVVLPAGSTLFQFGVSGNGKMTAMLALRQPFHFMKLCIEAYLKYGDYLILSMLGTQLSWVETSLPGTLVTAMPLIMGVSAFYEQDEISLKKKDKWIFLLVILVTVVSTPMMLLSWTDVRSDSVEGLQGRYYLPVLSLAMLVITKFSLYNRMSDDRFVAVRQKCAAWCGILSCIAVYYMERLYLTR